MFDTASRYSLIFKDNESFLLISEIEKYVNGVEIQTKRIERFKRREQSRIRTKILNYDQLFLDCHFYFICIDKIDKFLEKLSCNLNNENLKNLSQEFKFLFDVEIRNDLEHLDERALGQKWGKPVTAQQWKSDFLNFYSFPDGDFLSFGGKQFAVGQTENKKIKKLFRKFLSIIHNEYALKDKNFLITLEQDKIVKAILKNPKDSSAI